MQQECSKSRSAWVTMPLKQAHTQLGSVEMQEGAEDTGNTAAFVHIPRDATGRRVGWSGFDYRSTVAAAIPRRSILLRRLVRYPRCPAAICMPLSPGAHVGSVAHGTCAVKQPIGPGDAPQKQARLQLVSVVLDQVAGGLL